jgi:osmotically-inducible protein OsmY
MHFEPMKLFLILFACMGLTACTGMGIATSMGAVGGIAAAREGGLKQSAIDARIALEINDLWFKYDTDAFLKLNLTVEQGRVLVTGVVQDPDQRVEAIRLAWQPKGVVQVINEVRVEKSDGITGFARDSFISTNLRRKLIFDRDVQSINYTIDTVQGTVYLMGIAQDQVELNKVIAHAKDTGYVRQVISYVKLAGDPVDGVPTSIPTTEGNYRVEAYSAIDGEYMEPTAPSGGSIQPVQAEPLPLTRTQNYNDPRY